MLGTVALAPALAREGAAGADRLQLEGRAGAAAAATGAAPALIAIATAGLATAGPDTEAQGLLAALTGLRRPLTHVDLPVDGIADAAAAGLEAAVVVAGARGRTGRLLPAGMARPDLASALVRPTMAHREVALTGADRLARLHSAQGREDSTAAGRRREAEELADVDAAAAVVGAAVEAEGGEAETASAADRLSRDHAAVAPAAAAVAEAAMHEAAVPTAAAAAAAAVLVVAAHAAAALMTAAGAGAAAPVVAGLAVLAPEAAVAVLGIAAPVLMLVRSEAGAEVAARQRGVSSLANRQRPQSRLKLSKHRPPRKLQSRYEYEEYLGGHFLLEGPISHFLETRQPKLAQTRLKPSRRCFPLYLKLPIKIYGLLNVSHSGFL